MNLKLTLIAAGALMAGTTYASEAGANPMFFGDQQTRHIQALDVNIERDSFAAARLDRKAKPAEKKAADSRWIPSARVARISDSEGKERLDSVIGYDNAGNLFTRQIFQYDEAGRLVSRVNSMIDPFSGDWEPIETYGYEWTDYGYILTEYTIGYGSGMKNEYVYNDRRLGIQKMTSIYIDDEWLPVSKSEYDYDDNANIIDEKNYNYLDGQWIIYDHNTATWNEAGLQTSVECMSWNGTQWIGVAKEDYVYFNNDKDRLTYLGRYLWIPEEQTYRLVDKVTQEFNPAGQLTFQQRVFWNDDKQDWSGNYPSWDSDICTNVYSRLTYDERGRQLSDRAWYDYEGTGEWFMSCEQLYSYTDLESGDYDMEMTSTLFTYPTGQSRMDQRRYGRFNQRGQRTWAVQQLTPFGGTELVNDYEEKMTFDEAGNETGYMTWRWEGLDRIPNLYMIQEYNSDNEVTAQVSYGCAPGFAMEMDSLVGNPEITEEDLAGWEELTKFDYSYEHGTRTSKMGWRWNAGEWMPNFGNDVVYDFNVLASEVILPYPTDDPFKILTTSNYEANGADWAITTNRYFYGNGNVAVAAVASDSDLRLTAEGNTLRATGSDVEMIEVFDINGSIVIRTADDTADLSALARGIYVARATAAGHSVSLKLTVR